MNIPISEKVTAYITRRAGSKTEILVFKHDPEFLDAGLQVPGGTIEPGETPEQAVIREVQEETGLVGFNIKSKIDEYEFYTEYSKKYIHRYVFHIELDQKNTVDAWTYQVVSDGKDQGLNFHFYWMDISEVGDQLVNRLGDSIGLLLAQG